MKKPKDPIYRKDGYPGEFKRAHVYHNIEEAMHGTVGSLDRRLRVANARLKAQELAKEIKEQNVKD